MGFNGYHDRNEWQPYLIGAAPDMFPGPVVNYVPSGKKTKVQCAQGERWRAMKSIRSARIFKAHDHKRPRGLLDDIVFAKALRNARVLTVSADGTIRIFLAPGTMPAKLPFRQNPHVRVQDLAGGRFLSCGADRILRICTNRGRVEKELKGHVIKNDEQDCSMTVVEASVLEDGRIVSWDSSGLMLLWSSRGWLLGRMAARERDTVVRGVLGLPDGKILSWTHGHTLRIWSARGKPLKGLKGHEASVIGARLYKGKKILTWSGDGTLRLWSLNGKLVCFTHGAWLDSGERPAVATGYGITRAMPTDGDGVLFLDTDRKLRLWTSLLLGGNQELREWVTDSVEWPHVRELKGHTGKVLGAIVLRDGRFLSWSEDGTLRLWSSDGEPLVAMDHPDGSWTGALELDDGRLLSWGGNGDHGNMQLWSPDGQAIAVLEGHTRLVHGAEQLPDGNVLSYSADGTARIWKTRSGAGARKARTARPVTRPAGSRVRRSR